MKPMIRPTAVVQVSERVGRFVRAWKRTSTHHATHLDCIVLDVFRHRRHGVGAYACRAWRGRGPRAAWIQLAQASRRHSGRRTAGGGRRAAGRAEQRNEWIWRRKRRCRLMEGSLHLVGSGRGSISAKPKPAKSGEAPLPLPLPPALERRLTTPVCW